MFPVINISKTGTPSLTKSTETQQNIQNISFNTLDQKQEQENTLFSFFTVNLRRNITIFSHPQVCCVVQQVVWLLKTWRATSWMESANTHTHTHTHYSWSLF